MEHNKIENSPYATPNSDLSIEVDGNAISSFKRFSAWGVFGLSIITFGIYPVYWLYTRSNVLNSVSDNKISPVLLNVFIAIVFVSFSVGFLSGILPENDLLALVNGIISIPYLVLYLTVLFTFRNRLRDVIGSDINGIITFFGTAIYLQYKVNQAIDSQ